ncbi:MAG: TetR/AcrR family transcriptional regulator [Dehalococcoidia bacterium]
MSSPVEQDSQGIVTEGDSPSLSRVRTARRRYILDAALQTFLRDGYHGATMERVAEDADVSKQTLYNYFADKEELFIALVEDRKVGQSLPAVQQACEQIACGDVEEGLLAAGRAILSNAMDAEFLSLFRLILDVAPEMPDLIERVQRRVFLRSVEMLADAFARGGAAGRLRVVDSDVAARIFWGSLTSYACIPSLLGSQRGVEPERMAAGLADLLSHGLRATGVKRGD